MEINEIIRALRLLRKSLVHRTPEELKKLEKLFIECDKFADAMLYYTSDPYNEESSL